MTLPGWDLRSEKKTPFKQSIVQACSGEGINPTPFYRCWLISFIPLPPLTISHIHHAQLERSSRCIHTKPAGIKEGELSIKRGEVIVSYFLPDSAGNATIVGASRAQELSLQPCYLEEVSAEQWQQLWSQEEAKVRRCQSRSKTSNPDIYFSFLLLLPVHVCS